MLNLWVVLLLMTSLSVTVSRRLSSALGLTALQSVVLAAMAATVAYLAGQPHIYVAALLTVVIKGLAVPYLLARVMKKIGVSRDSDVTLDKSYTLLVAFVLIILAYRAAQPLGITGVLLDRHVLSAALSLILLGLFVMVSRKTAIMQILGLLMMENGLYLLTVSTTHGMPLVVEVGIFLDVIVGVAVMGFLVRRINRSFAGIDTEKLTTLKG